MRGAIFSADFDKFEACRRNMPHDEVLELYDKFRGGDISAGQRIVDAHLRVLMKVALSYARMYGRDYTDFLGVGYLGLWNALNHYDPSRGEFKNCAYYWIRNEIVLDLHKSPIDRRSVFFSTLIDDGLELGNMLGSTNDGIEVFENNMIGRALSDVVCSLHACLSPSNQIILERRLFTDDPLTLQEIADELGISREAVRQKEESIINRLKGRLLAKGYSLRRDFV